ncbi:MAG: NACHT domain-containing protein [Sulfuricurvum sp.]|uniref:NACHT domain-containing protein n=1 Tax=Sulfuricurvum sp. TaxID=2025608 RepID=UPI00261E4D27|nr:NACHT domain-containing protein [Sulfuricurvum sp.]MDD2369894.1 NACHT domain-containing protein [Sulfuricurvum sp.]MDD5118861.1 NACHT domain-containing protein [Sulfuricurvum sp.]
MATGLEPTLVNAGIKAISPITDVLLNAKFDKLKTWVNEHNLNKQLKDDELNKFFFPYFKRLYKKVSTIQTIVFPQQELDIEEIFEPLFLKDREHLGEVKCIKILDILDGSSYIIIDDAGMGKSTFAKSLTLTAIREMDLVPIFIELRTLDEKNLLDTLRNELNSVNTIFNNDVFLKLLEMKKFLIVLDGFDEISFAQQPRIAQEISELSIKSEISLVLTSRPENQLPRIPHSKALKFIPLRIDQTKSLIHRYDVVARLEIGEKLIKELDKVPSRFLQTPLLVALLYRTYGFNNSIASKTSTFYDEIYNAMYKGHDLTKVGFSREKKSSLDYEDFRKLLRAFAFILLTTKNENIKSLSEAAQHIEKASKLSKIVPSASLNFLNDLLSSVPLMYKDGNHYRFMHKTIMEFFAAEFIAYSDNALGLLQQIYTTKIAKVFEKSFDYLEELKPHLFKKIIVHDIATKYLDLYNVYPQLDETILTYLLLNNYKIVLVRGDELSDEIDHAFDFGAYFEGSLYGEQCSMMIGGTSSEFIIPYSVRKYLYLSVDDKIIDHDSKIFDGIENYLSYDQIISLDHELLLNILSLPVLKELILNTSIWMNEHQYISVKKCISILQELKDEESEEKLISLFLE